MKSKLISTFLIIAIIALLAVYYFLGMDYLKQRQGHEVLTPQIIEATQTLAQTPEPHPNLLPTSQTVKQPSQIYRKYLST